MWDKYVTRRLAVQVAQAWNFGWGQAMEDVYGVSVTDTLVFRDRQKTDYYVDKEMHDVYVSDLYNLLEDKQFLQSFHRDAQNTLRTILDETTERLRQVDVGALSNVELLTLYTDFILPRQTQFYIRMWTVFNIGEPLSNVVQSHLRDIVADESEVTEYLLSFSSPLEPNDVLQERMDLLRLAISSDGFDEKQLDEHIELHTEKYKHIPMFDFDHEPYLQSYFREELCLVTNPEKELRELEVLFRDRRKEFEANVTALQLDDDMLLLLEFLKENVFLRDHRDMIRQKLNVQLRILYSEIAKRLQLSVEQVAILTNDEIVDYLRGHDVFSKEEIEKREQAYLLVQKGEEVEIFSGSEAHLRAKQELESDIIDRVDEIRGVVGSKGIARGKVSVVFTNRDLSKVSQGDIMVATMTRQDFVPAMRKAAALVTDEGSVTAHAAIISRELGIPCIVASKIATRALQDGDLVEVDAEQGIVTIEKHSE